MKRGLFDKSGRPDGMDLFNELFNCYFSTIYHVLKEAANKDLTDAELRELIAKTADKYGFPGTTYSIVERAIDLGKNEDLDDNKDAWPFFDRIEKEKRLTNGLVEKVRVNKSRLKNMSMIPLSNVEKMWLKSVLSDPRIKLFMAENVTFPDLNDVEPLFDWDDFVLFDKYSDGDPYQEGHYIEVFRKVLNAVRNHSRLEIKYRKANNRLAFNQADADRRKTETICIDPDYLEYSERDDKFRLIGYNSQYGRSTVNMASIISCDEIERIDASSLGRQSIPRDAFQKRVLFELVDEKNALERFLMSFSHYEKEAEYLSDGRRYRITVFYDEADEKDVVIRVLSFGPYVKVVEPDYFVGLVLDRLQRQRKLASE